MDNTVLADLDLTAREVKEGQEINLARTAKLSTGGKRVYLSPFVSVPSRILQSAKKGATSIYEKEQKEHSVLRKEHSIFII